MNSISKWCGVAVAAVLLIAGSTTFYASLRAQEKAKAVAVKVDADALAKREARIAEFKKAVAASPTTLGQVIADAEKETGGRAFSSEMEIEDGKLVLDVELVVGDKIRELHYAADTGKRIADDDDDDGDDDGDDDDDDDGGDDDGR